MSTTASPMCNRRVILSEFGLSKKQKPYQRRYDPCDPECGDSIGFLGNSVWKLLVKCPALYPSRESRISRCHIREKSDKGLVGEIHHFIRELYDGVRRQSKFWKMIQEQKQFCDPESPAIFSSPWVFDDLYDPWRILLHSELYFLSVIFGLHAPHTKPFGINDVETALLVCRLSYIKQDARATTICPRCSIPAHALFLAGLFLAKTPFTEGVNAFPI